MGKGLSTGGVLTGSAQEDGLNPSPGRKHRPALQELVEAPGELPREGEGLFGEGLQAAKDVHGLEQGSANSFCKGPENKRFRFCGSYSLSLLCSAVVVQKQPEVVSA